MKSFLAALPILLALAGCAGHPKPVHVSTTEGPETAIAEQQEMIQTSAKGHADVLAPREMDGARDQLKEARKKFAKGESKAAYEDLGISRAYLNQANGLTEARTAANQDILAAREKALVAGANQTGAIKGVDGQFREYTREKNDYRKMTSGDRENLRQRYLNAEVAVIKHRRLGAIDRTLSEARVKGAPALVPQAYNDAMTKYRRAVTAIEADRHSEGQYRAAVVAAGVAANSTLALTETALTTQRMTPEQRAQVMQDRNKALQEADALNAKQIEENMTKEDALLAQGAVVAAQGAALGLAATQNEELRRRELADKAVKDAAKQFDKSEADVYRQDENLVIRLKKVNFASGRSDLPAHSLPILEKVKAVMAGLHPDAVKVEGHTDSVGSAKVNQRLSEQRADAVAKFLENDPSLEQTKIETAGYGYSKPITSNKGKADRAVNRRVDVVITPGATL